MVPKKSGRGNDKVTKGLLNGINKIKAGTCFVNGEASHCRYQEQFLGIPKTFELWCIFPNTQFVSQIILLSDMIYLAKVKGFCLRHEPFLEFIYDFFPFI